MNAHVTADAVVVGAGTAGLNAAVQLARIGLGVVVVERRAMGEGGARWCNGIVPWQFERAGVEVPRPPEVRSATSVTHMLPPDGRSGFTLDESPTLEVDMRLLNERLLDEARRLGVRLFDRASAPRAELEDGRLVAIEAAVREVAPAREAGSGQEPAPVRFDAPLFVDASGRRGVLRHQHPTTRTWCPDVAPHQLCSASQYTHRVADPDRARAFLDAHGARPGESVNWVGFAGGFSVLVVHVHQGLDEVGVLTGTLAADEWGSGRSILELTRARLPWIGEPLFGGQGLIPLRRPYARFTAPGLALVGDAACQVFPAHGSGIGIGLIAGRMLAEAVERDGATHADDDGDPGSEQTLWDYQSAFQREFGGTLAAYDVVRRLSTSTGGRGVQRMFRAGMLGQATTGAGLDQTWTTPPSEELPRLLKGLSSDPGLAVRVLPWLARSGVAHALYARYPTVADERQLRRWSRTVDVVLGTGP